MKRVLQLDGVRGLAILLVLIWHYVACEAADATHGRLLIHSMNLLWSGVDLFFVLSGFLIVGILLDNREAKNYFRAFYRRRIFRILPLYFLLLISFACIAPFAPARFGWLTKGAMPLWSYAFFVQNIFMGIRGAFGANWLGVTWSLAVEEQFYLVIPVLIYFLPRRTVLGVFILSILVAPLLRSAVHPMVGFVNMPFRADSLIFGGVLAILVRWQPFMISAKRNRGPIMAVFAVLLAGAGILTFRPQKFGELDHLWLGGLYAIFILIAFGELSSLAVYLLRFRILIWLGNLSYAIYVFHQGVCGLLFGWIKGTSPEIHGIRDAYITLAALAITLLLAQISFVFFESPLLKIGHRAKYDDSGAVSPPLSTEGSETAPAHSRR